MSSSSCKKLAGLEETDAPFSDHLDEAFKFIRLDVSDLESSQNVSQEAAHSEAFHGNEEWLLRWLLKKLQGSEAARLNALAWRLLSHLIRTIPVRVVARLLEEKKCPKFMTILSQTLEDACRKYESRALLSGEATADTGVGKLPDKKSRKRRRSGEPVAPDAESTTQDLSKAVVATIIYFTNPPDNFNATLTDSTLASEELMKSVLRTAAEEAAKILGSWLTLCQKRLSTRDASSFTSYFVEIWESRRLGSDALQIFSQHCAGPLLSIIRDLSNGTRTDATKRARNWKSQLDRLLALNVILPSKASSAVREKLIDPHVREDATVGPVLLETSIRSVGGRGRIRSSDAAWIRTLFAALKTAMSAEDADFSKSYASLDKMLQLAIHHRVKLDNQELLPSIPNEYAFRNGEVHWEIIATMLKLDSTVFLASEPLLLQLLSSVTAAAFKEDWEQMAGIVIDQVTIPLMEAFAKARDLIGFMRHWHSQMLEFIHSNSSDNIRRLCAWEDNALQAALRENLESWLTPAQIGQLIDWLEAQLQVDGNESAAAACVLLQAVSGSIDRRSEETVDTLDSRLSAIMFTEHVTKKLSGVQNQRYSWRRWNVQTNVIFRAAYSAKEALVIWKACSAELAKCSKGSLEDMETYHAIRCACALWAAISGGNVPGSDVKTSLETLLVDFLVKMDKHLAAFSKKIEDESDPVHAESPHVESTTLAAKGCGWYANSYVACMLEEYPRILELIPRLKSSRQQILRKVLHIASITPSPTLGNSTPWAENEECNLFPHIWSTALKNDKLLNSSSIISQFIEVMLQYTMKNNTADSSPPVCNIFVAHSLYFLPKELLSKHHRELIIKAWPPKPFSIGSGVPITWKLKMNVMKEHTFYDGMSFQTLIDMAETLPEKDAVSEHQLRIISLVSIFGEFVRRTIGHVLSTANQPKSKIYLDEISSFLKSQSKERTSFIQVSKYTTFDHIGIKLIDTVLRAFSEKTPHGILDEKRLRKIKASFKKTLLSDLKTLLDLEEKGSYRNKDDPELFLSCTSDALDGLKVGESDLQPFMGTALPYMNKINAVNTNFGKRLESFLLAHAPEATKGHPWSIKAPTAAGRFAVKRNVEAEIARVEAAKRPRVARDMAESIVNFLTKTNADNDVVESEDLRLCKLLALQYVIATCEDSRDREDGPGISGVYEVLFEMLPKLKCIREFMLTCETMENILYTKPHWISQYHIDSTLSAITTICSPNGPSIRNDCSTMVFSHLCALLHAVLSKHRSKIQDRLHLILQCMQALLRCLFTPLAHTASKFPGPPWLPSTTPLNKGGLQPRHAEKFARLITLICEPSSGAVSHHHKGAAASLNSETDKAKRVAGQHMIYLLTHYIHLRSGLQLPAAYQEKLKPALWSILNTTSTEIREVVAFDVNSQGGVLWGELLNDWKSFGRFNGN